MTTTYPRIPLYGKDNPAWLGLDKEWLLQVLKENEGKPTVVKDVYGIDYATLQKYLRMYDIDIQQIKRELITLEQVEQARTLHEKYGADTCRKSIKLGYYKWKDVQEDFGFIPYNHRVTGIEYLNRFVEVYDLEIEDTHNFIAGEICVHNSAYDPNFQNTADSNNNPNSPAPIQTRTPFGPRKGYCWYSLDWSQQEVRIFADDAEEEFMLNALYSGVDVNTANTNRAWGGEGNPHALKAAAYSLELGSMKPSKIQIDRLWQELEWSPQKAKLFGFDSPESARVADRWLRKYRYDIVAAEASIDVKRSRTRGKNLTYAKIYGAGASGVMDMLYCTRWEAKEHLDLYDEVFPRIPEWQYELSALAKRQGYIHNRYGRRLMVDPGYAYRAGNYRVQGTAAEQMKRACVACSRYIEDVKLDAHLMMPIHDELIFEVLIRHSYIWFLRGLRSCMEGISRSALKVPMPVEVSRIRETWAVKEKIELGKSAEAKPIELARKGPMIRRKIR